MPHQSGVLDLSAYRASPAERRRTQDLLDLIPGRGELALDIGARDGHFSHLLAQRFDKVVALDLQRPRIDHPRIECLQGDAAALQFASESIDFVLCAEVLEHIPPHLLGEVCAELQRVSADKILIGVPYRQDIRVGRTTCQACGGKNPPWGHVNSFDEHRLAALFDQCTVTATSYVGQTTDSTNALSCLLMDLAGNPYGTYKQEEPCIHCGARLAPPPPRDLPKKVLTRLAFWSRAATTALQAPRPNWIHMLLTKHNAPSYPAMYGLA